jgi:hypothetical protein
MRPPKNDRPLGEGRSEEEQQQTVRVYLTRRRCEGPFCWCKVGDYPSPSFSTEATRSHAEQMRYLARVIRLLEIKEEVSGLG